MTERQRSTAIVTTNGDATRPAKAQLAGETVSLEPIDPARHAADLYAASHQAVDTARLWRYMSLEPFAGAEAFAAWLGEAAASDDPLCFAVRDRRCGRAKGMASYLRITPDDRVIEIGSIWFGPELQRTRQATEALFLMMRHALDDLGYRRLEWKCDAANEASRRAALRLGFTFEGIFYRHMIVKGRNRDTAWYSILSEEWPAIRRRIETWLSPVNFDEHGRQRHRLLAPSRAGHR